MKYTNKPTGRASSIPLGLAGGTICGCSILLIGTAVLAKLIDGNVLQENAIGYSIMVILLVASYGGARFSYSKIKRKQLVVCVASGAVQFGILLGITALFFDGQYNAVGVTALLILCGSGLAALHQTGNRGGKRKKIRIANR